MTTHKKYLFCFLSSFLLLSGCQKNAQMAENKGQKVEETASYYNNNDFNDYVNADASLIKNQWENYGISSPYILRFNGMYYLYSSTTSNDAQSGVRGYKSRDLVHWDMIKNGVLDDGYVVSKRSGATAKARAPEVYYYNGSFYMYESYNNGAGHFVLKSDSPEGPFEALSKATIDNKYDGTIFFGRNENPYFFTASKGYVNLSTMQSMESIIDTNLMVNSTDNYDTLYVESPTLFSQNGKTYLLYSSMYSTLTNYQIGYSVSDGWEHETPSDVAENFHRGDTDTLLFNTNEDEGFTGLGHPSVVLGPDLDSHYLVYDSLNDGVHNNHSLNIDRLLVSNNLLSCKHQRYNSLSPKMADAIFEDENDFQKENEYYLSQEESGKIFTVEYNFKNAQQGQIIFNYKDSNNYHYIKMDATKSIEIYAKKQGNDSLIKSIEFYNYFQNKDLHSLRLSYREGEMDLYFDNILKLANEDINLEGGKIGYLLKGDMDILYTALSSQGKGSSDQNEFKQINGDIPAPLYKEDMSSPKIASDEQSITLKHNQYARYAINANKSGEYTIEFVMSRKCAGKQVVIAIDDGENYLFDIPQTSTQDNSIRINVGKILLNKGLHYLKVQGFNNSFIYSSLTFKEIDESFSLSYSLTDESQLGDLAFSSDSRWSFINGKLTSLNNYRNIALTRQKHVHDFDLSVDLALTGSSSIFSESSEAGIVFRCSEYVDYESYMENHPDLKMWNNRFLDIRAYYLAFTSRRVSLYRYDVGLHKEVQIATYDNDDFGGKHENNVILKVRGNRFDLFINREFAYTFFDSYCLTTGACGLYTTGAEASYRNLKIVGK